MFIKSTSLIICKLQNKKQVEDRKLKTNIEVLSLF